MKLDSGTKLEMNFIIKKFLELPQKEKERLYTLAQKDDAVSVVEIGVSLLTLLIKNGEEMGKFVGPFDLWTVFPDDYPYKAALFYRHFKDNAIRVKDDIRVTLAV